MTSATPTSTPHSTTISATNTSALAIPNPYSVFFHPHLLFSQKLVSYVASFFLPLQQLGTTTIGTPEARDSTQQVREKIQQGDVLLVGSAIKAWTDAMQTGSVLAESTGVLPFRKQILHDWKIITHASEITYPPSVAVRNDVTIRVRFPVSLLPPDVVGVVVPEAGRNTVEIDFATIDWKTFALHVPVLVQFHGGGFMAGSGLVDGLALDHVAKLVQLAAAGSPPVDATTTGNKKNNDLITISVDYGLAPEHPFPVAVMDGLSVIEYLLSGEQNTRAVHISGISAGSSLSLIIGLESFRHYPGRVLSIEAQCPMLNPAADTLSYYLNQKCFPAMTWLRWCWRAYLSLDDVVVVPPPHSSRSADDDDEDEDDPANHHELEAVLRKDSNYVAWNTWKTQHPSKGVQRLVHPIIDLPDGLNGTHAPKIILRVNLADPLHDDGKEMADAFVKKHANFVFLQNIGLHVDTGISANQDNKIDKHFQIWSQTIFGGDGDGDGDNGIALQKLSNSSSDAVGLFG